jgi:hypothetical protein
MPMQGFVFSARSLDDYLSAGPALAARAAATLALELADRQAFVNIANSLARGRPIIHRSAGLEAADYTPQTSVPWSIRYPENETAPVSHLAPEQINHANLQFIALIAQTCRARKLDCLYVHGPWFDRKVAASQAYLATMRRLIEAAGLPVLAGTPLPIPFRELGDDDTHVHPAFKRKYTAALVELMRARGQR